MKLKGSVEKIQKIQLCGEESTDKQLPTHIILGAAVYERIRSPEPPILGENRIQSQVLYGKIVSMKKWHFLKSQSECRKLCSVDMLGLVEGFEADTAFHKDFTEHLHQAKEAFYQNKTSMKIRPSNVTNLPMTKELVVP